MNYIKKEFIFILVLSIFTFLSSRALFHDGFFRTIDDITSIRVIYLVKELSQIDWINNFPVRLSGELAHGYGYPLYLFYAPLAYYIGALLMIFGGLSHIVATKWVYVFPLLIGPFAFYFAARQKLDRLSSLVGSCFYALFPFRGWDTYSRGGVGEAWTMAFLPLVVAGIFTMEKKKTIGGLIFAFFLFLSIISHNIGGLLIIGFAIFYGLIFKTKVKAFWGYLALGLGMGAFFWIPSIYYLPIVKVTFSDQNTGQILNFLEPLSSIFNITYPIGRESKFSGIFLLVYLLGFSIWFLKKNRKNNKSFLFWGLSGLFLFLIQFQPFSFFWESTLAVSRILQFPWRVFIVLSFILPFFISTIISLIKNYRLKIVTALVLVLIPLYFLPTFKPAQYSYYYEYRIEDTGKCAATWGEEYLPVWVEKCATNAQNRLVPLDSDSNLMMVMEEPLNLEANIKTNDETEIIVNKYFFPGWRFEVDGKEQTVDYKFSEMGVFKGKVPSGDHLIHVYFSKTPLMYISDVISLASLGIFIALALTVLRGLKLATWLKKLQA